MPTPPAPAAASGRPFRGRAWWFYPLCLAPLAGLAGWQAVRRATREAPPAARDDPPPAETRWVFHAARPGPPGRELVLVEESWQPQVRAFARDAWTRLLGRPVGTSLQLVLLHRAGDFWRLFEAFDFDTAAGRLRVTLEDGSEHLSVPLDPARLAEPGRTVVAGTTGRFQVPAGARGHGLLIFDERFTLDQVRAAQWEHGDQRVLLVGRALVPAELDRLLDPLAEP